MKTVELPAKHDGAYPPLILDGASGVGKTQQGFALLKEEQSLIFVVLDDSSQTVYKEMNGICNGFAYC